MADFKAMFEEFHRIVLGQDDTNPDLWPPEPPASDEAFELLEQSLGKTPSDEMKDFYRVANGGWLHGDVWDSIERIVQWDPVVEAENCLRLDSPAPKALPLHPKDTLHLVTGVAATTDSPQ